MNTAAYTGPWQNKLKEDNSRWMGPGSAMTAYVAAGSFRSDGTPSPLPLREECSLALSAGAEIVFRLPAIAVLSGADVQAFATLTLADRIQTISHLAIPVNGLSRDRLEEITMFLFKEPLPYQKAIRKKMAQGLSFPEARAESLDEFLPGSGPVVKDPMNSYAVELRLASLRRYSRVKLSLVQTEPGSGGAAKSIIDEASDQALALELSAFLRQYSLEELAAILQMTPSFPYVAADALKTNREEFLSCTGFLQMAELLSSETVTQTQVRRGLLMMLLGIRLSNLSIAGLDAFCPYIRIAAIADSSDADRRWRHVLTETDTCALFDDGTPIGNALPDESRARLFSFDSAEDALYNKITGRSDI